MWKSCHLESNVDAIRNITIHQSRPGRVYKNAKVYVTSGGTFILSCGGSLLCTNLVNSNGVVSVRERDMQHHALQAFMYFGLIDANQRTLHREWCKVRAAEKRYEEAVDLKRCYDKNLEQARVALVNAKACL